jgi:hypothetical protein
MPLFLCWAGIRRPVAIGAFAASIDLNAAISVPGAIQARRRATPNRKRLKSTADAGYSWIGMVTG